MNNRSVRKFANDLQVFSMDKLSLATEGHKIMQPMAFISFLHDLIREYQTYKNGYYSLHFYDLPRVEQTIFLSHLLDADEFAHYSSRKSLMDEAIRENEKMAQQIIDDHIDDVYHEDMREMRLKGGY